ncbi:MAG TPA: CopD family protein [Burkholderiaceae bacterium]|nr:CopD family protein [Burkholderiaceae bacterium]
MDLATQWLQPLFAAWIDVALIASAGIVVVRGAMPPSVATRLPALARRIALLLGVGLVAYLAAATVAMAEPSLVDFPGALWLVLTKTDFGDMGWVALAAWLMLMAATCAACRPPVRKRTFPDLLFITGLAAFAYARAATGHAADHGFLSVAVLVHTVHIVSACAWAGSIGICVLSVSTWRTWTTPQRSKLAHRLSTTATIAVPAVVASGLINVIRALGHSSHPGGSSYLDIAIAKISLVAIAVVLGTWNRQSWMTRLDDGQDAGARGFGRVLLVEAIVLVVVIVLAAKLGTTMIPI